MEVDEEPSQPVPVDRRLALLLPGTDAEPVVEQLTLSQEINQLLGDYRPAPAAAPIPMPEEEDEEENSMSSLHDDALDDMLSQNQKPQRPTESIDAMDIDE